MILVSKTRAGQRLAAFPQAVIDRISWRLNAPGSCTFSLPAVRLPQLTDTVEGVQLPIAQARQVRDVLDPDAGHEIEIVDLGATIWEGPLLALDETEDTLTFAAQGLQWYLQSWHITETLQTTDHPEPIVPGSTVAADQHLIVASLVDYGQLKPGGDRGIDTGAVTPAGVTRVKQYKAWELVNVADAVGEFTDLTSQQQGCDLEIQPGTRRLRLWTPRRGRRRQNLVFNDRNVRTFGRRIDRSMQANVILGVGAGEGEDMVRIDRAAASSIAVAGRIEDVYADKGATTTAELAAHAEAQLRMRQSTPNLITVTVSATEPRFGDYELGDECRIHYSSPYQPVDVWRRIVGIDLLPPGPDGGELTAELHLERLEVT